MFHFVKGHKISNYEKIVEAYTETSERSLVANVSAENIMDIFQHFIAMHEESLFFILELPVSVDREELISSRTMRETHNDVYYIDGLSRETCMLLLIRYGELLINDGMSKFGFGGHESYNEIMLDKYNLITIYSLDLQEFHDFFEPHDIEYRETLITAWDTFTPDSPGISEKFEYDGKSVYDLPEELEDWGIYLAETREDN